MSIRIWTTLAILLFGTLLTVSGALVMWRNEGHQTPATKGVHRILTLAAGLRWVLFGGCAFGAGLAYLHEDWLIVGLCAVIGLEELYETTLALQYIRITKKRALKEERATAGGTASSIGAPLTATPTPP